MNHIALQEEKKDDAFYSILTKYQRTSGVWKLLILARYTDID